MKSAHPILKEPIRNLGVSEEIKDLCKANEFKNLADLVQYPVSELTKMSGFNMKILKELITFLKKYNLDKLLKNQ